MLRDLDRLMADRHIDWAVVMGSPHESPDMYYMTRGARVGTSILLKAQGSNPILIHTPMEREEAARSGLALCATIDLVGPSPGGNMNPVEARLNLIGEAFRRFGVRGNVAFYGKLDMSLGLSVMWELRRRLRGVVFVEETERSTLAEARLTKEDWEVERMRKAGLSCARVFDELCAFIGSKAERGGRLVDEKGQSVRIGDLRSKVHQVLAEEGLTDDEGTILAQGRDAAVPHSRGDDDAPVRTGVSTVFDLFPREKGGGYFFDVTRSFCIGHMPDRVKRVYNHVHEAQRRAMAVLRSGSPCARFDALVQGYFEERGYVTLRSKPGTERGYVHGLGHGIGLEIHEIPTLRNTPGNNEILPANVVFTVEPGLYFPDEGIGIRIEDTVYLDAKGELENLTKVAKRPLIEPKGKVGRGKAGKHGTRPRSASTPPRARPKASSRGAASRGRRRPGSA